MQLSASARRSFNAAGRAFSGVSVAMATPHAVRKKSHGKGPKFPEDGWERLRIPPGISHRCRAAFAAGPCQRAPAFPAGWEDGDRRLAVFYVSRDPSAAVRHLRVIRHGIAHDTACLPFLRRVDAPGGSSPPFRRATLRTRQARYPCWIRPENRPPAARPPSRPRFPARGAEGDDRRCVGGAVNKGGVGMRGVRKINRLAGLRVEFYPRRWRAFCAGEAPSLAISRA